MQFNTATLRLFTNISLMPGNVEFNWLVVSLVSLLSSVSRRDSGIEYACPMRLLGLDAMVRRPAKLKAQELPPLCLGS